MTEVQLPMLPDRCHCDEGCAYRCHTEGYGIEPYCLCSTAPLLGGTQ